MVKAVIFDMDGTMVDTENMWRQINQALARRYGKTFDESIRQYMMGRKEYESLVIFRDHHQIPTSVEDLMTERKQMVLDARYEIKVNPGLRETLDLLDSLSLKRAIATSAFTEFADRVLTEFDLRRRFDAVVTGDEVIKSKPEPDIFLEAARRIGIAPADCVVIEDAQMGITGAKRAGMYAIAIPNDHSRHHDFSQADRILGSMVEITPELLHAFS